MTPNTRRRRVTKRPGKAVQYPIRDPFLRTIVNALRKKAVEPRLSNPMAVVDWAMRKGVTLGMKLAADVITALAEKEGR